MKLDRPLKFGKYVNKVKLPTQLQPTSGDCVVTGWGQLFEGGPKSLILKKVTLPVVDEKTCKAYMGADSILDSMLCCGYKNGGKGECFGDGGGPLYCDGYQAGIVSWSRGCAHPETPSVYTRVSHFVDWINEMKDK